MVASDGDGVVVLGCGSRISMFPALRHEIARYCIATVEEVRRKINDRGRGGSSSLHLFVVTVVGDRYKSQQQR